MCVCGCREVGFACKQTPWVEGLREGSTTFCINSRVRTAGALCCHLNDQQAAELRMSSRLLYVLKSCRRAVMGSLLLLISLKIVCRDFPLEHTVDFMMALKETFWRSKGMCVRAAGKWMITLLQMYGKDICQDVPPILHILHSCTSCMQQGTSMPFLCQAVVILICCHEEVTIDNFSRLLGPTDSETWRRIREFCL
ncbi:uncharacterized protein LOC101748580 isoform X3 [Gallus gallus]|uniref:uncharacterized protein LOC101748580 isoform X3 n=1 Tax=Gallus gallus TaxID=9031 RepID=UPI001AE24FBA|nr:uncharacterized protein LOC101748580 isoform X3 [Gallus gallus]